MGTPILNRWNDNEGKPRYFIGIVESVLPDFDSGPYVYQAVYPPQKYIQDDTVWWETLSEKHVMEGVGSLRNFGRKRRNAERIKELELALQSHREDITSGKWLQRKAEGLGDTELHSISEMIQLLTVLSDEQDTDLYMKVQANPASTTTPIDWDAAVQQVIEAETKKDSKAQASKTLKRAQELLQDKESQKIMAMRVKKIMKAIEKRASKSPDDPTYAPRNFEDAKKCAYSDKWIDPKSSALQRECAGFAEKGTFKVVPISIVDRSKGERILHSFTIFKYRPGKEGDKRYKARIVLNGSTLKADWNEVYSSVVRTSSVRLFCRLVAWFQLVTRVADLSQAYIQTKIRPEDGRHYMCLAVC